MHIEWTNDQMFESIDLKPNKNLSYRFFPSDVALKSINAIEKSHMRLFMSECVGLFFAYFAF